MSQPVSAGVSARSLLIAGLGAAVVGAASVTPVSAPALTPGMSSWAPVSAALDLTSVTSPIEAAIKNTYNAVEPWAAYGAEWGDYILGLIPGLWWVAPGVPFAYYTAEPLVQAGVYSVADVLGLDFAQIGPDVSDGVNASIQNGINYGLAWLSSLVPFPPLPPLPGAAVAAPAASALPVAATDLLAAPQANSITTPLENAIKNTYNAVEPWAAYGAAWANYILGLIPVVNWFAPAIPLAYYTIEPLVRAGTYTFADVVGLDFAAIGPDISTGITTSINNAIRYTLSWANIPLPPPLPGASVSAGAVRVPAAAAVEATSAGSAATVPDAPVSEAGTPAARKAVAEIVAPQADGVAPAREKSAPAVEIAAPEIDLTPPAVETEAIPVSAVPAEDQAPAVPAEEPAPAQADAPPADAPPAAHPVRRGQTGTGSAAKAQRPARADRSAD